MILPKEREHRRTVVQAIVLVGGLALTTSFVAAGAWTSDSNVGLQAMVDEVVNVRLEVIDEALTARAANGAGAAANERFYRVPVGEPESDGRELAREGDIEAPGAAC